MDQLDQIKAGLALSRLEGLVAEHGLTIELNRDMVAFQREVASLHEKSLTENFALEFNTETPTSAFWLALRKPSGEAVAVQALRLINLGTMSLAQYLKLYWPRIYSPGSRNSVEFAAEQGRYLAYIQGRVVYAGEAWVHTDYRRQGVASVFAKIGILAAMMQQDWNLDYIFAFTHASTAENGFVASIGYTRHHSLGIRWVSAPSQIPADLWFVYSSRSDVLDLIDALVAAPHLARTGLPRHPNADDEVVE